jgi:hypothetical protein
MRPSRTFSPEQLEMMARALDRHCSAHGIHSALEKEDVARHLLSLCDIASSSAESLFDILEERRRGKVTA